MAEDHHAIGIEPRPCAADAGPPARFPKAAELIANHIRRQIVRGELAEGDTLPLEGEMQQAFGVSRPTLREAFRILEAEKLISVVRGSRAGARVHAPTVRAVARYAGFVLQAQGTTLKDIYDSRLAIEPACAWVLARGTDPAAAADSLAAEAARLRALVEAGDQLGFAGHEVDFHRRLVACSGNRTLLLLTDMVHDILAAHQVELVRTEDVDPDTQHRRALKALSSFDKLIRLIRGGDAEGAMAHWRLHMVNANRTWIAPDQRHRPLDVLG